MCWVSRLKCTTTSAVLRFGGLLSSGRPVTALCLGLPTHLLPGSGHCLLLLLVALLHLLLFLLLLLLICFSSAIAAAAAFFFFVWGHLHEQPTSGYTFKRKCPTRPPSLLSSQQQSEVHCEGVGHHEPFLHPHGNAA